MANIKFKDADANDKYRKAGEAGSDVDPFIPQISATLLAGSAAIGKLAANSGVDIGDVDVTSLPALPAGNNNIGDVDIASIAAGDNNIGNVDIVSLPASTNTLEVVGDVADDAGSAGNPVAVGGVAKNFDGTTPGSVSAEDDRASLITDLQRRLYTNPHNPFFFRANENHTTAQTANALKAAPGAGLALFVQTVVISNGATAGTVKLVEDTGGTPVDIAGPYYFAINGGLAVNFEPPLKLTADKDLGFTSVTVTTHTITVSGFTAPG